MSLFFSTVHVHHRERMPTSGPVLIVSNHHSSLVDPVALLATMPRFPRFLAKAALWGMKYAPLRPFLWLSRPIPVHRHIDGGGDNTDMFSASRQVLANGEVVALFGEGVSHNLPGLLDLKTGAARIALGVDGPVTILPVGLIYDDRATFRSRAIVYIAEPIVVAGSVGGDENRDAVRALTETITDELEEVAPSWATWEAHNAALIAAQLAAVDMPGVTLGEALTALNRAIDDETHEGAEVLAAVVELEAESARLGLDIETVVDRPRHRVGMLNWQSFVKTALFLVPTVLGRLVNLPPHALLGLLAARQALHFQATFKILVGVFLYPLWWVLVGLIVAVISTPLIGLVVGIALPIMGYVAARFYGRLRRFRNRQTVRARVERSRGESDLIVLRHAVLNATDAVLQVG